MSQDLESEFRVRISTTPQSPEMYTKYPKENVLNANLRKSPVFFPGKSRVFATHGAFSGKIRSVTFTSVSPHALSGKSVTFLSPRLSVVSTFQKSDHCSYIFLATSKRTKQKDGLK